MSINFLRGHPTLSLLPYESISRAYDKVVLENDYSETLQNPANRHPLSYGTDPGNWDVRKTYAAWNDRLFNRKSPSDPDTINLTAGASYGIANILTSLTSVARGITRQAFVVTPCYYLINGAFVDAGFEDKITAIDELQDGEYDVDVVQLEKELIKHSKGLEPADNRPVNIREDPLGRGADKKFRFVLYIVPTFSNPSGATYSVKTRQKLLELARKYDLLIISDDVYELLDYSEDPGHKLIPRIVYLDRDTLPEWDQFGHSITNGTFSKIIAPGLRLGWQETATPKLVQQLASTGANRSGGTPNQLSLFVVNELIISGELDRIVLEYVAVYKDRAKKMKKYLGQYLPASAKVFGGDGGYFLWVDINQKDKDHREVEKILKKRGVILGSGDDFEVYGDSRGWGHNCVRLSLSYLPVEDIEKGIKIWGEVLKEEGY